MTDTTLYAQRKTALIAEFDTLVNKANTPIVQSNGIYQRWRNPVITADHIPLHWRYDFNPQTNPMLMERIGVNAAFNAGAILHDDRYLLVVRVEGSDRKSFFAVAESKTGIDGFKFWDRPITMPQTSEPDVNVYDMRLTYHEDGWIYGLFCVERKDPALPHDLSAAIAQCGIARTKDLLTWERLNDLVTASGQQRNVVLHPEFIDGQYAFYTRPQDGFIEVGGGGGIGWGLSKSIEEAVIESENIVHAKAYHTVYELKNGQGPTPLKTTEGWLHLAHGVRNTAAGLRYVLYMFMTDLDQPWKITYQPGGLLIAPEGEERVGDVSNVAFCNGWIRNNSDEVFIYYASADTRMHVATSSIAQLVDYCKNTPEDGFCTASSVQQINRLIDSNMEVR